ncbi:hypothetical protein ABN034_30055 [Actinopolymorpha sp. B11F2]|uniref:hypothetical protein n=1 Tax=Actinopolymorpha sp. B11F2 TaxID=3160862 RepID=UPI0032E39DF3
MWDATNDQPVQRIVDLARQTNVRLIRYLGGTVANLFQWKRAVGRQADRGCQVGGGFVGSAQPYDSVYGPDENQRFVDEIGADTTIMANGTTQSVHDAADFVEYMNAPVGANPNGVTDWARVRADNGLPKPYGVDVWELGNELYLGNQINWRNDIPLAIGASDGATRLLVLNRDRDTPVSADVVLPSTASGDVTVHALNGDNLQLQRQGASGRDQLDNHDRTADRVWFHPHLPRPLHHLDRGASISKASGA